MKIKIVLITTEGCAGCSIQENIIEQVIENIEAVDVEFETHDFKDCSDIDKSKIHDFPATCIFVNDELVHTITGTYPKSRLSDLLNLLISCSVLLR